MDKANFLFITHVEKEGPFLKVWGQVDKATAINVEQALLKTTPHFEQGFFTLTTENLQNGVLCCAKYKDNKYYRARIVSTTQVPSGYVEVSFLDFGNRDVVPCHSIKSMQNFTSSFISLPPLANSFLLAEAVCATGEWNEVCFQEIVKEVKYAEANYIVVAQAVKYYYVRLLMNGQDLAHNFINRGLMARTSLHTQEAVLLTMMSKQSTPIVTTPASNPPPQTILTYKAFTLEAGTQHPIYVSYISDGPCHFSVQLKQTEDVLVKLMNDINSMPLKPLEDCPLPGTVCVARCIEDGHICRAVVTNEVDSQFKVFYVDFGNSEIVPLEALYQIPFKYVIPKVMAIRFALAGIEKSTMTLQMKCAFKKFVDNRLLLMKVIPSGQRTALPKCELFDPQINTSALDVLHRAAVNAYPEPLALNRGFSQPVRVSYVFSCNRFYVQLKSKENELAQLMMDLQTSCQLNDCMDPDSIKEGLPCCALFEGDEQWYRSQIVEVCEDDTVKVRYIDFGNEELVPISSLKAVEGEQLTVLRPQAIECCLNGYQNMGEDQERDNFLEDIILENEFTMKVIEMQSGKALVELIDGSNYNVASLLLEKIANARSQVSPMLVQAGNRIEHRKSLTSPTQNNFRDFKDRKPGRDLNKGWNDKTNDSTSWRQENKDKSFRNRENDQSNESWRQNSNRDNNFKNRQDNKTDDWSSNNRLKGRSFSNQSEDAEPTEGNTWNGNAPQAKDTNSWDKNSNKTGGFKKKDTWGDDANKNDDDKPYGYRGRDQDRNKNDKWSRGDSNKKDWESKSNDSWGSKGDKPRGDRDGRNRAGGDWRDNKRGGDKFGDKDNWGKGNDRSGGDWNDKGSSRGGKRFEKDSWEKGNDKDNDWGDSKKSFEKKPWDKGNDKGGDSWGDSSGKGNNRPPRRDNRNDKGSWGDSESPKDGGQGFKKSFHRDGELSPNGSERAFQKGPRSDKFDSRNKNFDKPMQNQNSWEVAENYDVAPNTATYNFPDINLGTDMKVTISWFHSPAQFYVQLAEYEDRLKTMMEEIQQAYKSRKPSSAVVNAPVISIFPEDNVLYRARVLEVTGGSYKVFYVDFGNVATIDKVWGIEPKFMDLPAHAVCCGLYGVEPVNEQWGEASAYSLYFDKESFTCRFIENNKARYLVDMTFGECSVSTLLETDGLAKSNIQPVCPILLELMRCQQFWATVISINSLGDILIQTLRNEFLKCSVFNLDHAQETFIQNLQQYLNLNVIVDVHNISNETLFVTFYEWENGNKIQLVEPDPGTYSHFPTLLNHPVFYENVYGYISCIDDDVVYIVPYDYTEELGMFEDSLAAHYEALPENTTAVIPAKDFLYAVKDQNMYWHRVISLEDATEDAESVKVQFVDSGKIEEVTCKDLRELTPEFIRAAKFCFPLTVKDKEVGETFSKTEGYYVMVTGIKPKKGRDDTVFEAMSIEDCAPPVIPYEEQEYPPTEECQPTEDYQPIETDESYLLVSITHVDTPNEFYIQKSEDATIIDEIQARLQAEAESMQVLESAAAGVLCAAPYSLDEQWYRAEVLDADSDITTVRFVDYGNTDVLSNDTVKVRALPPDLLAMAVHATRSSLKVMPVDEEWSPEAIEVLDGLVDTENVTATFIDQDEKTNYVELYVNGESVKEMLINKGLAVNCAASIEEGNTGFVSHINSPSEFFIQLECYANELERFSEQLSDAENFPELDDLSPGSLCAAMYSDEQWYRARILSNTVAGVEVLFVDFGNSAVSSNLRQLPEDLVVPPPLAQKCCLKKPEGLLYWSPQANAKFSEIAAEGQTIFTVEKLSNGETALVRLLLDGEDIINQLLPETVDGHLANVESLDSFDVVINGETSSKLKLEAVPGYIFNDEAFDQFKEIDNNGETTFQIEYVTEDTVCLYINGKDIRTDLSTTKQTSHLNESFEVTETHDGIYTKENLETVDTYEQSAEDQLAKPTESDLSDSFGANPIERYSDSNTSAKDTTQEISEPEQTCYETGKDEKTEIEQGKESESDTCQYNPETEEVDVFAECDNNLDSNSDNILHPSDEVITSITPLDEEVVLDVSNEFQQVCDDSNTSFSDELNRDETMEHYVTAKSIDSTPLKSPEIKADSTSESPQKMFDTEICEPTNFSTPEQAGSESKAKENLPGSTGSSPVKSPQPESKPLSPKKETQTFSGGSSPVKSPQKESEVEENSPKGESSPVKSPPEPDSEVEETSSRGFTESSPVKSPQKHSEVQERESIESSPVKSTQKESEPHSEVEGKSTRESTGSSPVKSPQPQSKSVTPETSPSKTESVNVTPEKDSESHSEVEGNSPRGSTGSSPVKSPQSQSKSVTPETSPSKTESVNVTPEKDSESHSEVEGNSPRGSTGSSPVKSPQSQSKSVTPETSPSKTESVNVTPEKDSESHSEVESNSPKGSTGSSPVKSPQPQSKSVTPETSPSKTGSVNVTPEKDSSGRSQKIVHMNGATVIPTVEITSDELKGKISSDMASIVDGIVDGVVDDSQKESGKYSTSMKTKNVDEQSDKPVGESGEKASDIRSE